MLQAAVGDAHAVIRHLQDRLILLLIEENVDLLHGLPVAGSVFHEIKQHLLHQQRVHGHQHGLLRQMHLHGNALIVPKELTHRALDDLLHQLRGLFHAGVLAVDTGDGEKVFRHPHEPLGLLVYGLQQLPALLGREGLVLLQKHIRGPYDTREGGADVVAHAPQKVSAHFLSDHLPLGGLHLLGPAGQGAGQDGNGHHHQKGQGKARQGEADVPVGLGEDVVHTEYAQNRAENAE